MASWFLMCLCYQIFLRLSLSQERYLDKSYNYVYLLSLYKSGNTSTVDIVPLVNASSPMTIKAEVELYALNDFDEVAGQIELAMSVTFTWTDEIVEAVTGLSNSAVFIYTSVTDSILVPYNQIWSPKVVLYDSVSSASSIGGPEYMCRYNLDTGIVTWSPKILIKSACSPDVTYYPFDKQICTFSFVTWRFTSDEILFQAIRTDWIMTSFEENGEWDITHTSLTTEIYNSQSFLRMSLEIERKPLYFAFNIIFPVIALSLLTLMVFWLPSESGERVGFSVTCFLSFVVMLNTIMDILPRTSSPMSYLCYYIVVMMIFSGLTTTLAIIQVRIFHKFQNVKVPGFLQTTIRFLKCDGRQTNDAQKRKNSIAPIEDLEDKTVKEIEISEWSTPEPPKNVSELTEAEGKDKDPEITWMEVSRVMDIVFFLGFLGAQIFFSVTFLLPVAFRA